MCGFEFENKDYFKCNKNVVLQIKDIKRGIAIDENGIEVSKIDLSCPNITLCKEVLECCGFNKREDSNDWEITFSDCRIVVELKNYSCKYYDYINLLQQQQCSFMTLPCLQHFVRMYAQKELDINHKQLAKYVKENYH